MANSEWQVGRVAGDELWVGELGVVRASLANGLRDESASRDGLRMNCRLRAQVG